MDGPGPPGPPGAAVTPNEAYRVLGLAPGADPVDVRHAYRQLIRAVHPDHHGPGTAEATATLNEAFRVLRTSVGATASGVESSPPSGRSDPPAPPPAPGTPMSVAVLRPDGDSLSVAAPADDVFLWIRSALGRVGQITYVDADAGLVEAVVAEASGNQTSVVVSLQGRGDGTTEAFCTAERLSGSAAVDLARIVDRVVEELVRLA